MGAAPLFGHRSLMQERRADWSSVSNGSGAAVWSPFSGGSGGLFAVWSSFSNGSGALIGHRSLMGSGALFVAHRSLMEAVRCLASVC